MLLDAKDHLPAVFKIAETYLLILAKKIIKYLNDTNDKKIKPV